MRGIGNVMNTLADLKPANASGLCAAATSDQYYRYACQEQSALRFIYFMPASQALLACDGLSSDEMARCRQEALSQTEKRREDIGF